MQRTVSRSMAETVCARAVLAFDFVRALTWSRVGYTGALYQEKVLCIVAAPPISVPGIQTACAGKLHVLQQARIEPGNAYRSRRQIAKCDTDHNVPIAWNSRLQAKHC
eukprot:1040058-Rhodomonas_salina.6